MRIKRLGIRNIRSYENEEIVFPGGSILLAGDVGSGKTTILLAIEYALFGLQPGQRGSALLRNDSDFGEVTLEFEVDGHSIIIERKLRRSSKTVSNEYAAITIDGEKIESSITEIKTKVLKLLGYPSEFVKKNNLLYRYTVYTPQEQMKQIILEEPQARLNVLRHIFGIEKYKRMRENLTIVLSKLKDESKLLANEVKSLENDRKGLESKRASIDILNKKIDESDSILNEKISARKAVELEIKGLEEKIKEKDQLEKEVEKANILLTSKNENLSSMRRESIEVQNNLSEMDAKFDKNDLIRVSEEIVSRKELLEELNKKYIETISKLSFIEQTQKDNLSKKERVFNIQFCPTCLQNVPDSHKYNIMNDVENLLSNLKKEGNQKISEKESLEKAIRNEKAELQQLENTKIRFEVLNSRLDLIEKSKIKSEEIKKSISSLEKDMALLLKHNDQLKAEILKMSKFTNLYKIKQQTLKNAFKEEKDTEIEKAEFKKELQITLKEIDSMQYVIKEKEDLKSKSNKINDLINWLSVQFTGLIDFTERNIMIKLRAEFSKLFNKWFSILVPEGSFEVQLDESFTPVILQGEVEMDYSFLSGGERTAVALAYRLALNQTLNSLFSDIKTKDLVILDEPTEGFSDVQLDRIRDVLEELEIGQLIVVSHEQKMEGFVDNVLKIKKQSNSSSLDLYS